MINQCNNATQHNDNQCYDTQLNYAHHTDAKHIEIHHNGIQYNHAQGI
jgi:hypothetical protein